MDIIWSRVRNRVELLIVFVVMLSIILAAFLIEMLGYKPCVLCLYQRIPYYVGLFLLSVLLVIPEHEIIKRFLLSALIVTLVVSAGLGLFHAGVEFKWWQGPKGCSSTIDAQDIQSMLESIKNTNVVSCDKPSLLILGYSLSVWNAIWSLALLVILLGKSLRKYFNKELNA